MALVVLLSVIAIMNTCVVARPADTEDNNIDDKDSVQDDQETVNSFMLPTSMKHGYKVTINGTINKDHKTLTAILPARAGSNREHCRFVYDFEEEVIYVSPQNQTQSYNGSLHEQENPIFSLNIEAFKNEDTHTFILNFCANKAGEIQFVWEIDNFVDYETIVIEDGAKTIQSLHFEFM